MPPELSAPSRKQHDRAQRQRRGFRQHLLQAIADARGRLPTAVSCVGLLNALGSLPNWYSRTWNFSPSAFQQIVDRAPPSPARCACRDASLNAPCCANRPPAPPPRSAAAAAWRCSAPDARAGTASARPCAVSSSQIAIGRTPVSIPWLRRTCQNSSAPAARTPSRQHPQRPRRQQHELSLMENCAGIFEQKFEHVRPWTGSSASSRK